MHLRLFTVLLAAALAAAQTAAPAPAPAATPLPLPADHASTCTAEAMLDVTSNIRGCFKAIWRGEESEECCAAMFERYGTNSTAPTANCFCVPEYWTQLSDLSKVNYADWGGFLDKCSELGAPIPYYQDGEGPCSGAVAAEPEMEPAEATLPILPMRTFGGWLAGLGSDPWDAASFTFAILSAIGGGVMAWSFLFDAYADLRTCMRPNKPAA